MKTESGGFVCPFETKGREDGSIDRIDLGLARSRSERLDMVRRAFLDFHAFPSTLALEIVLPTGIQKTCSSNEELKDAILPYQAEILAAEMHVRFWPYLPYQLMSLTREQQEDAFTDISPKDQCSAVISENLVLSLEEDGYPMPRSIEDVAAWIEDTMEKAKAEGMENPHQVIVAYDCNRNVFPLITITPSNVLVHRERAPGFIKTDENMNSFGIVMSPFYPKEFGRYSSEAKIVLTRERDFMRLSNDVRHRIRFQSNTALKQGGIKIHNLSTDTQGSGLWDHKNQPSLPKGDSEQQLQRQARSAIRNRKRKARKKS